MILASLIVGLVVFLVESVDAIHLGKYWRFDEADVRAWLERQRVGGRTIV